MANEDKAREELHNVLLSLVDGEEVDFSDDREICEAVLRATQEPFEYSALRELLETRSKLRRFASPCGPHGSRAVKESEVASAALEIMDRALISCMQSEVQLQR